ncbi:MAG: DMT family transporter, partial [Sphingomonadaceae bacterium]|nr:DMT family transporter [Sphingomonadaceae bacterium]
VTGMALNFATVGLLPLAEAQSIWFTIPLFATILGALWLGEQVGRYRWGAVFVGFIGVLIVFQPQSGHFPMLGGSIGLASSVMVAVTAILVRQIGRTEPSLTTVFWFGVISATALVIPLFWALGRHDAATWGLLAAMGLVGSVGQIALTFSLRFAPVSVVAPVDYASLIWATAFGVLLFGNWPTPWTWVGTPVVIASGLYIVWREHRLSRENTSVAAPN